MSWQSFYIQKRNFNSTGMKAPERKGKGRESQLCKIPLAFTQKTGCLLQKSFRVFSENNLNPRPLSPLCSRHAAAAAAKSLQSCPTLYDSIVGSPPGSSVPGFPQARTLENPRDRGAWWAAVYGVAQSRTQLKRLSSSSRG